MSTTKVPRRKPRKYSVSRQVTERTIEKFLCGLSCPRSLTIWLLYVNKEHQQLAEISYDPLAYPDSGRARDAYLATEFLSKSKFLSLDVDPEQAAVDDFLETERHCREVNRRFRKLELDPTFRGENVWLLNAMIRKTHWLLGESDDSTSFDPEEWIDSCGWGPGTTARISGKRTNPAHKFQHDAGMTKDCYILLSPLFSAAFPRWGEHLVRRYPTWGRGVLDRWLDSGDSRFLNRASHGYFDKGNIVLAVPKKASKHRIISKEPGLNCFFQLGLGRMISRRLLRFGGFDLRDQTRNNRLAFYASLSGSLATVDKKDASGCIATEVVRTCLPDRWFSVMDSLRSKCGVYKRKSDSQKEAVETQIFYEKFSSMGNGFTFPLQSLLFAAAALAVCEYLKLPTENVGVFGDDIIIPSEAFVLYSSFCTFLGFKINTRKSFASGPFRESCGEHYFEGADLKPLYLKERLSGFFSIFKLANGIKRLAHRNLDYGCDNRFLPAWVYLRDRVPEKFRFSIPEGFGDGGFVMDFDEALPCTKISSREFEEGKYVGIEGFRGLSHVEKPVMYRTSSPGLLLARLHDVDLRHNLGFQDEDEIVILTGHGNEVGLRRTTKTLIRESLYPEWNNLGPWITSKGSLFLRASSA